MANVTRATNPFGEATGREKKEFGEARTHTHTHTSRPEGKFAYMVDMFGSWPSLVCLLPLAPAIMPAIVPAIAQGWAADLLLSLSVNDPRTA